MARPVSDEQRARFEENLAFLRQHSPALCSKLLLPHEDPIFETTSGGTLTMKLRGRYVESRYSPAQDPTSQRDPGKLITEPRGHVTGESRGHIIYLGSGLGYHINQQHTAVSGGFLVEKDVGIFSAALYIIEPEILRSLILLIDEDVSAVEKAISQHAGVGTALVEHSRSMQFHREYFRQVRMAIENVLRTSIASNITTQATMRVWLINVLRNLLMPDYVYFGSAPLLNAFQGPVILVSSGPFLEEVSDNLRRWSRNIPLLALLPSVSYLQSRGVMPDFAVTTDAGFWNRYRFTRGTKVPLITTYSADPVLLRNWNGESFFFSHDLPIEGLFASIGELSLTIQMQGTAATVMLFLARLMGFTEIYLAGYDFSFLGLKDHHRGAGFERLCQRSITRFDTWETKMLDRLRVDRVSAVDDCLGRTVLSTYKLLLYRNWFEREVDLTSLRRLNNGAKIRGLALVSEADIDTYGEEMRGEFQRRLKNLPRIPIGRDSVTDDAWSILEYIEKKQDPPSKMRVHERIFGPHVGPLDEWSVESDLLFVQKKLSRMMERLI
jgi:hypothetical protein